MMSVVTLKPGTAARCRGHQRAELVSPAKPRHAPQHAVGAAWIGRVQVRHQARIGEQAPKPRRAPGFERAQAHAGISVSASTASTSSDRSLPLITAVATQVHAGRERPR